MFLLRWAFVLAILALVAGVLGFTGLESGLADIARFFFYLFLAGVVLFVLLGLFVFNKVTGP